jgi:glycosyltransferase involved in cell wall biosynthesis
MTDLERDPVRLVRCVADAVVRRPDQRQVVILSFSIDAKTATDLLTIEGVSGVLLPRIPDGLLDNSRVGTRPGCSYRRWRFPIGTANEALVVGSPQDIGVRGLPEFLRRGFWRVWFINPLTGEVKSHSFLSILMRVRLVGFISGVVSRIRGMVSRIREALSRNKVARQLYEKIVCLFYRQVLARRRPQSLISPRKGSVILVVGTLGPGGSERQVVNTAIGLKQLHGMDVTVACIDISGPSTAFYRETLEDAGIVCIEVGCQTEPLEGNGGALRDLGLSRLWRSLAGANARQVEAFCALFLARRPEIVHCFLDQTNVSAGTAAVACGVPRVVLSMRSVAPDNFWPDTRVLRAAYRLMAGRTDAVFSNNSAAGAADYRRWLHLPHLEIQVVPNGIDLSAFQSVAEDKATLRERFGIPEDALVLGGVMRLTEEKRPDLWVRSAIEISRRHPNTWFVLAGHGPMMPDIRQMFERARVSQVTLPGSINDVAAIYRMLDVFLLTSRMEGLPNVLIEAQAAGVPVVTTDAGGAGETVKPGVTGIVASDDSPQALAGYCLDLLTDEGKRNDMAEATRTWARERFGLDAMLGRTLALYRTDECTGAGFVDTR